MDDELDNAARTVWLTQLAEELDRLRFEAESNGFEPVGDLLEMVQQEVSCLLPHARKP